MSFFSNRSYIGARDLKPGQRVRVEYFGRERCASITTIVCTGTRWEVHVWFDEPVVMKGFSLQSAAIWVENSGEMRDGGMVLAKIIEQV